MEISLNPFVAAFVKMKGGILFLLLTFCLMFPSGLNAQVPTCDSNVPYYFVDLRGTPDSIWTSNGDVRQGNCCGTVSPIRCISFEIMLDSEAVAIEFSLISGALPPGALFYQIGCGPQYPVDSTICLSGPGPHYLTFCKPGSNLNIYQIKSVPQPIFPGDDTVRVGCYSNIEAMGLDSATVTWTSVYPGARGSWDSFLDRTSGTQMVTFTPDTTAPAYIDYEICGFPYADECGYILSVCDTVRMWINDPLSAIVTPNPANYCASGPGVVLAGTASGGDGNYTYIWRDPASSIISTSASCLATAAGTYTLEVNDGLSSSACPGVTLSIPVSVTADPVVDAGNDTTVCPSGPVIFLNGFVANAAGGSWTGGSGTFFPDAATLNAKYTPTAAEITNGSVMLYLTSASGGSCPDVTDSMTIYFSDSLLANIPANDPLCYGDSVTLSVNVTSGTGPYSYQWSGGQTGSSIYTGEGNYCATVTDAIGCKATACYSVTNPAQLTVTASSTDASSIGGSDGTASAVPAGGNPPYSYLWSNGEITQNISGLSLGIYQVTVTDANGCTATTSTVVNDPRCLGFTVSVTGASLNCNGEKDGKAYVNSISGGTAPYAYTWNTNPVQTTDTAYNLTAGTWTVIVTDAFGCSQMANAVVTEPAELENAMTHTNVMVIGASTGTATANPSGGTPGYSYLWSNGQSNQTATGLSAGTWYVTISDSKGCSILDSVSITEPPCENLYISTSHQDISCNGAADGWAVAEVLNGNDPISYLWNTGATTDSVYGLIANAYSVTVTDSLNCTNFANVTITEPSPLSVGLVGTNVSCNGGTNGSIDLTVTGGTLPYTFKWSNYSTSEDLINLKAGAYSVTVSDANGCTANANIVISQPSLFSVNYTKADVSCNNGSDGSIDLTVNGAMMPYSYLWSNGSTTEDQSSLSSNSYTVTITDANGCMKEATVLIDQPDSVKIDSIITVCPVPGDTTATVTVYTSGGDSVYQISFDNGLTWGTAGDSVFTLEAGFAYQVVARDSKGCLSFPFTLNMDPVTSIQNISYASCFPSGTTNTLVTVVPAGGDGGPYQVSYDNGLNFGVAGDYDSTLTIGNSYAIVVMDGKGCLSVASNITIADSINLTFSSGAYTGGWNTSCNGAADGSVDLTVNGGTSGYSYSWSNGATTEDLSGLAAGTYIVTVTDTNGCTAIDSVTLSEPPALATNLVAATYTGGWNTSCNGAADGSVDLTVNGGTSGYSYSWSNGATTEDLSGLAAGTYIVTVTDTNGCTAIDSVTLSEPPALATNLVAATYTGGWNTSCNGAADGSVDLTVNGGTSGYSYSWSNGATTEDLSGLAAGTYIVTVTDTNGCTAIDSVTLSEPPALATNLVAATYTGGWNTSCNGAADGSVDLTVNGGTTGYSYSWSNGATIEDLSGLAAGTYIVTVTDTNGCTAIDSVTLSEPPALATNLVAGTYTGGWNTSCNGVADGSVDLTVNGGTSGYSYSWSNGATTEDLSGLGAGTYIVTVTDTNGCTAIDSVTLSEPPALATNLVAATYTGGWNTSCNGAADGSVDLTVNGGTSGYSYSWSNGATTEDLSGLAAGTYIVTVTDTNGCTAIDSVTLSEPPALATNLVAATYTGGWNTSCNGAADGSVDLTVNGGTSGYSYSWSNGATAEDLSGLAAGTYIVTVTDTNGCTAIDSVTLSEPPALAIILNTTDVSCNGGTDGAVDLSVTGGTAGYSFSWSNGATSEDISMLSAGVYYVLVTDTNGCTRADSATIAEPPVLSLSLSGNDVLCNGDASGSVSAAVSGGVAPYTYLWNTGDSLATVQNIPAGVYFVDITDANGCAVSDTIVITEPAPLLTSAQVVHANCFGASTGFINLTVSGGATPYTYDWSSGAQTQDLLAIGAGTYMVLVTDSNGCSVRDTFTVNEPTPLVSSIFTTPAACNGDSTGAVDLTVTGGTGSYFYLWSNGAFTQDLNNIPAGTYYVVITDGNGCVMLDTAVVQEASPVVITALPVNVSCFGLSDGEIDLTVTGGTAPYVYLWSDGAASEDRTGLTAGYYSVTVIDNNGCMDTTSASLSEPAYITVNAGADIVTCDPAVNLNGNFPQQGQSGYWSLLNGTASVSNPSDPQSSVTGISGPNTLIWTITAGNCSNSDTVLVSADTPENCGPVALDMPTGYSPNGDMLNDYFVVKGIEYHPNNELTVFNRWGNLVYQRNQYQNQWNGESRNGQELPDGTYFVVLDINNGDIVLKGFVDIRR